MIVDTFALVAIGLREPAARAILETISHAATTRVSAANLLETWMVLDRRTNVVDQSLLESVLADVGLTVEPVTLGQVEIARDAFRLYGKGSGHKAGLNFGDCFAYALAKHHNEPLLFVGNDFTHTNIVPAMTQGAS